MKGSEINNDEIINSKGDLPVPAFTISTEFSLDNSFAKLGSKLNKALEEIHVNLDQNLYLDQIFTMLDSLNDGETFNRVLLLHIIEFGKLSKEDPIELKEFFITYFNVYDSMKSNRINLTNQLIEVKKSSENIKIKLNKNKNEILLENGLTSNSCLKFILKNLSFQNISYERDKYKLVIETMNKSESITITLDNSNINKKFKMKISANDFVICCFSFMKFDEKSSNWVKEFEDLIMANKIFETNGYSKYYFKNFGTVELETIFINSKINFYQNKFNETENSIEEIKQNIMLFESSLNNLQKPFSKVFSSPSFKENINHNPHEYSEKVEKFVSNILGKKFIFWEKVLFTLNKCLLVSCLVMMILYRTDYLTILLCSFLLALEINILSKIQFVIFIKILLVSIVFDLIWLLYYSFIYRSVSPLEGENSGAIYRKISTILSGFVILMKLIFLIAIWRTSEMQRYNEINPQKKQKILTTNLITEEETKRARAVSLKSNFMRPSIKKKKNDFPTNLTLRDMNPIDLI